VQIVTPQNKDVQELNARIQARISRDPSKPSASVSGCLVGDAVRMNRSTVAYKNGDEGMLEDIVAAGVEDIATHGKGKRSFSGNLVGLVRLEDRSLLRVWNFHMDPAYATTVHKVQGSEYARVVLVMVTNIHPKLRTREILYTSVTRARDHLHIMGNTNALCRMVSNTRRTVFSEVADEDCRPEGE
jgi:ATP-dependent exoDNAse (exonuclease V) alpha subunit